jgi:S-layer protein
VAFTGGAGADSVLVGATTKTIAMGAGDDTVEVNVSALGTGGKLDGGAGTADTLFFTNAADAETASATTTFGAAITGFEKVKFGQVVTAQTDTINLANLGNANYVVSAGAAGTGNLVVNGFTTGGTLEATAALVTTTVGVTGATTGSSDVFNIKLTGAAGFSGGTITVSDVETINLLTDDTASTPTGIAHSATITADKATKLVVSGDAGATVTLTGSTLLNNINTSAVTKGAVSVTTAADVATTFVGGATNTTVNLSSVTTSTNANSITTGAGNDTITGGAGVDTIVTGAGNNTVNAGAGADVITGGAGNDTINGGAGADTIVGGGGDDVITGGAGADVITLSGKTSTVTIAAVGETGTNNATLTQTSLITTGFDVVKGAAAGDKIDLSAVFATAATGDLTIGSSTFQGTASKVVVTYGTYDAAAGTFTFAANGADSVVTYDNDGTGAGTTFESIVLVGYHVASGSTAAAGVITLG